MSETATILVVDDTPLNVKLLAARLIAKDFRVASAAYNVVGRRGGDEGRTGGE